MRRDRPVRVLREHLKRFPKSFQAAVAHRDGDVPQDSRVLRPGERAPLKPRPKLGLRQSGPFFKLRRVMSRLECVTHGRAGIPGTHLLADVASEHVRSDACPLFDRNRSVELDGQVRDTAARVDGAALTRRNQRLGRAGLDAASAGSAAVRRRRIRLKFERRDNLAEKKPGTRAAR